MFTQIATAVCLLMASIALLWLIRSFGRNPLLSDEYTWLRALFYFEGVTYRWSGWYGCQLESYELLRVKPGTVRIFKFTDKQIKLRIFSTDRRGLWLRHTWALDYEGRSFDQHNERITEFKDKLKSLI